MIERYIMKHGIKPCSSEMGSILSKHVRLFSQLCPSSPIEHSRVGNENIPDNHAVIWPQSSRNGSNKSQSTEGKHPLVGEVYDVFEMHKWTREERAAYLSHRIAALDEEWHLSSARDEGKEEGMKQGMQQGMKQGEKKGMKQGMKQGKTEEKKETARRLLAQDVPIDTIQSCTELSKEEIQAIQDNIDSER